MRHSSYSDIDHLRGRLPVRSSANVHPATSPSKHGSVLASMDTLTLRQFGAGEGIHARFSRRNASASPATMLGNKTIRNEAEVEGPAVDDAVHPRRGEWIIGFQATQ